MAGSKVLDKPMAARDPEILSILITRMDGRAGSTDGLGSALEPVLAIGEHGPMSSCCIMGDVVPTGSVRSGPGEGSD